MRGAFLRGYIACALWASIGDDGRPLDRDYTAGDIAADAHASMAADCAAFEATYGADLTGLDPKQCGLDFWLTRNRHGAGFWDRGLGERGDRLTAGAHAFGESLLYVAGDGSLEVA